MELGDNGVDGELDSSPLDILPTSVVVVINSFEPSDIIVGVGDEMDSKIVGIGGRLIMMFPHHLTISESDVFLNGLAGGH